MKRALFVGLFVLGAISFAEAADQTTANFQGNCSQNGGTISCTFDALLPASHPSGCESGAVLEYHWDFGDGSPIIIERDTSSVAHTYSQQAVQEVDGYFLVGLDVFCPTGEPSDYRSRMLCVTINSPGCIWLNSTWS